MTAQSSVTAVRLPERIERTDVHVRVLVADDAPWVVATDDAAATALAPRQGWSLSDLREDLEEGRWASDDRWGWGIIVRGEPAGFALVTDLASGSARIMIRIAPHARGRRAGREVLRQLADHHFSADPHLVRLTGRAHEHNVPMQRVFNAAGYRMEARYRDSFAQPDGFASEWGYALTRADWEQGAHRPGTDPPDLHGLRFALEETVEGPTAAGLVVECTQEGRRVTARYGSQALSDGELGGLLVRDVLQYRFVHERDDDDGASTWETGSGRARLQRREDGRYELVDQWSAESGVHGRRVLVQVTEPA